MHVAKCVAPNTFLSSTLSKSATKPDIFPSVCHARIIKLERFTRLTLVEPDLLLSQARLPGLHRTQQSRFAESSPPKPNSRWSSKCLVVIGPLFNRISRKHPILLSLQGITRILVRKQRIFRIVHARGTWIKPVNGCHIPTLDTSSTWFV